MQVIFADGFESGTTAAWSSTTGTPTVVGTPKRSGVYALECEAGDYVARSIVAGNRAAVARVWFYHPGDPTGARAHVAGFVCGGVAVIVQMKTTGELSLYDATTEADTGPDIGAAGSWHSLDMRLVSSADPWVVTWAVDRVDQGSVNLSHAAADITTLRVGNNGSGVVTFGFDDIALSLTSADYPLDSMFSARQDPAFLFMY